ncbi:RNA-directed DNA polymerase, eukaryota, reverse transcriptase zinc-binding domain protein [Tanacetum coccineum]
MLHYCKQSVLCRIEDRRGKLLMFYTIVYAANGGNERRDLWKDLSLYKGIVADDPWAIMGDMNVTLDPSEHFTGSSSMSKDIQEFKDCVNLIEIEDIASSGLFYTWTKSLHKSKQGDNTGILKKLDKAMRNEAFVGRKKSFRFSNFVTDKDEFLDIVKDNWEDSQIGCQMFKLTRNLKALKQPLKALAWKNGNLIDNVNSLRDKLKSVKQRIDVEPHNKLLREKESVVLRNYDEAMREEEKLLFQKAKIKWLSMGDKNNAFFHRALKSRYSRNRVNAIHDERGESSFVNKLQGCNELFKKKLCNVDAEFMVREVSNAEIKKAMFMIDDNKAPGPDGYTSHFFKKAWNVVGNAVCKVVREFFDTGRILSEINSTIIALVSWNGYLRKGRKMKPKRQNQTRNGKAWKRQSQVQAQVSKSQPKSTPKPKSQEKQV